MQMTHDDVRMAAPRERPDAHFRQWLGAGPGDEEVRLVEHPGRDEPGRDGKVRPIQSVIGPEGESLSVSPAFRWSEVPPSLPEVGIWLDADDPRLPAWLRPFNVGVLAAFGRTGRYMTGVGLKRHNPLAREIAAGTDMGFRVRGLATRIVVQAARTILGAGEVPIYQHGPDNLASARVADATGFPDRGWKMLEIHLRQRGATRG